MMIAHGRTQGQKHERLPRYLDNRIRLSGVSMPKYRYRLERIQQYPTRLLAVDRQCKQVSEFATFGWDMHPR